MTLNGTLRKNKNFLPQELDWTSLVPLLKKRDAICGFQIKKKKKSTIMAHKANLKNRRVSTVHHNNSFDISERKPEIVISYNAMKGESNVPSINH